MDKLVEIYKHVGGLAIILGKDISKEALHVYCTALQDLSVDQVKKAVSGYLNGSKNTFPTPGQLRAVLRPSDEDMAREAVSRIVESLSRYGGRDNTDRAKSYIGELGWKIVQKNGGWEEVCKIDYDALPTCQAQWRGLALSLISQDRAGVMDQAPMLPSSEKKVQSIGTIFKLPEMP